MAMPDISRTLTDLVAATPGVREVYPASSIKSLIASARPEPKMRNAEPEVSSARVVVNFRGGELDVYANICVDADHSLPTVLRSVSDAISTALAELDPAN